MWNSAVAAWSLYRSRRLSDRTDRRLVADPTRCRAAHRHGDARTGDQCVAKYAAAVDADWGRCVSPGWCRERRMVKRCATLYVGGSRRPHWWSDRRAGDWAGVVIERTVARGAQWRGLHRLRALPDCAGRWNFRWRDPPWGRRVWRLWNQLRHDVVRSAISLCVSGRKWCVPEGAAFQKGKTIF